MSGVLAAFVGSRLGQRDPRSHPIDDALARLSPLRDRLGGIGKRYLAEHHEIRDRAVIMTRLRARFAEAATPRPTFPTATALGQRIRTDFAIGDVVTVDGWLLARTEAEFCALVALAER